MKRIIFGFLGVIMLMPILACAIVACPMQQAYAAEQPCHQTDDNNGPMLSQDCTGVDLYQQNISQDDLSAPSDDGLDYAWVSAVIGNGTEFSDINGTRGPPDNRLLVQTQSSLILSTQRFRI